MRPLGAAPSIIFVAIRAVVAGKSWIVWNCIAIDQFREVAQTFFCGEVVVSLDVFCASVGWLEKNALASGSVVMIRWNLPCRGEKFSLAKKRTKRDSPTMRCLFSSFFIAVAVSFAVPLPGAEAELFPGAKRIVFVGDSITYSGQYIEALEACSLLRSPGRVVEFLNLGLPSETVSGLSEPGHAGGSFPRPDLHERLARLLKQTKPDLLVVCYGMNDGIYFPFSEERFQTFQDGMKRLRELATAAGAKVLHLTPPSFDPVPLKGKTLPAGRDAYPQPYEGYNDVLDRYSAWLLAQRAQGWEVVDAHGPMNRHLAERRKTDPAYRLAGDGVHIDANGHWLIAREVILHFGAPKDSATLASVTTMLATHPRGDELLRLVQQRQRLWKDTWLNAVGHQRPGMSKGATLEEAAKRSAELDAKIRAVAVR